MRRKWRNGQNVLWFVFGVNADAVWLSTASFTKRGAMRLWQEQQHAGGKPWRYWYRNGYRCRKARIRYALEG